MSGSRRQVRLGPHAAICTVRDMGGTSGFDRLHPFRAVVRTPAPGATGCGERSVGTTACAPPLCHRTCERDEGTNRPGHAISPGAPHHSSAGAAATLQPSRPASRVPAWRLGNGPCPQLSPQIPGQVAGPVYRHGEDWSCHLSCPPAGMAESRPAISH